MKLATISTSHGPVIGLIGDKGFLALGDVLPNAPDDMIGLIERWDELREALNDVEPRQAGWRSYAKEDLLAPVLRPGKIFAIGLNYNDHIEEMGLTPPEHQVWFSKQPGCANGPYAAVEIPKESADVDYEVEMVVVIGKRGRHIAEDRAAEHVFGYCVGNDVSARDWQMRTPQWVLGKSFDTHAPFGPWITTTDEVGDPHGRGIRCLVNGEVRQQSNTGLLCFNVWKQIAHLSKVMTLEPGDVIFTGTPGGVGFSMNPPQLLKAGDVVRCEVDGLGAIENRFVDEL